jgi:hypothetical protein
MGGVGSWGNMAWELVRDESDYRSIPIPLGLFQVLDNLDVFDPESPDFNPALIMSYASSPIHHSFSRGGSDQGQRFLLDIVNAEMSPDLNLYRGFQPRNELTAGGVAAPDWGKLFWFRNDPTTSAHGFYVGAGPYLAIETALDFDADLIRFFEGSSNVYEPNTSYSVFDTTRFQGAGALTLGYRARVPLSGSPGSDRNGVYIATNYSYLYGIYYESYDIDIRIDTDGTGLVDPLPPTPPGLVDRRASADGRGYAIDVAGAVILDAWEFTGAIDGIGNRMTWENLRAKQYTLDSMTNGSDFEETPVPSPGGVDRVELPMRYFTGATYDPGPWAATAEVSHGFQGFEFNGGGEYRLGWVDLRGGGRHAYGLWHPAWGAGFNLTDGFGVDLAFFGAATNIERARELGMAISLRLGGQS